MSSPMSQARNLLFDIFFKDTFSMFVGFRVSNIRDKQLWTRTTLSDEREIRQLAEQEEERFTHTLKGKLFFVATREHRKKTYINLFTEYYHTRAKK